MRIIISPAKQMRVDTSIHTWPQTMTEQFQENHRDVGTNVGRNLLPIINSKV